MRLRIVGDTHFVCTLDLRKMSRSAARFCRDTIGDSGACDMAVVATDGGRVVAFARFYHCRGRMAFGEYGTFVAPRFRRRGLAVRMWRLFIRRFRPSKIYTHAVTKGGKKLLQCLRRTERTSLL